MFNFHQATAADNKDHNTEDDTLALPPLSATLTATTTTQTTTTTTYDAPGEDQAASGRERLSINFLLNPDTPTSPMVPPPRLSDSEEAVSGPFWTEPSGRSGRKRKPSSFVGLDFAGGVSAPRVLLPPLPTTLTPHGRQPYQQHGFANSAEFGLGSGSSTFLFSTKIPSIQSYADTWQSTIDSLSSYSRAEGMDSVVGPPSHSALSALGPRSSSTKKKKRRRLNEEYLHKSDEEGSPPATQQKKKRNARSSNSSFPSTTHFRLQDDVGGEERQSFEESTSSIRVDQDERKSIISNIDPRQRLLHVPSMVHRHHHPSSSAIAPIVSTHPLSASETPMRILSTSHANSGPPPLSAALPPSPPLITTTSTTPPSEGEPPLGLMGVRGRERRNRWNSFQRSILEDTFKQNPWPDAALKEEVAAKISMTSAQVATWFQNKRARNKDAIINKKKRHGRRKGS